MKILHISNYYYHRGGDCTYLFALMKLLERKGHKNMIFSMHHPMNYESEYSKYFVTYIDYAEEVKDKNLSSAAKVISRAIYSKEARNKMEALIKDEKPDVAHIQSMHHHLTHSVLYPLRRNEIPVVWTLHDYTLICPNTHFLNKGKICEKCKRKKYYHAVLERCKKGSFGASAIAALETTVHRLSRIDRLVNMYITPSNFLREKMIEFGFNGSKIECIHNLIDIDDLNVEGAGSDYFLYIGRLDETKGIKTLIDAIIRIPETVLKIVGDGPIGEQLKLYVESKGAGDKIQFLGYMNRTDVLGLIRDCIAVILPSEWYENFPYAILEAFAFSKPVIGSRIGGIPELVRDRETGLLFEPSNADDLYMKIKFIKDNPIYVEQWGKNGNRFLKNNMGPERHYEKIVEIYRRVRESNKSK